MKKFIIAIMLITSPLLWCSGLVDKVHSNLKRNFGTEVKIKYSKFELDSKIKLEIEKSVSQKFTQNFVHLFKVTKQDSLIGIGLVDNVYGKLKPITFLVVFNKNAEIIDSEILKYRESYGGAVQNRDWLNQFKNKDASEIKFGKTIHGISGATISAKSVTNGIQKLKLLAGEILRNE